MWTRATFGVSDVSTAFPDNQDIAFEVAPFAPDGPYSHSFTAHGLFPVTEAPQTFYLLGSASSGSFSVDNMQLTLVFFPMAYGTVTPTS